MREFFNIGTTGQSLSFVQQECRLACDSAQIGSNPADSRFCTATFEIKEGDVINKYSCRSSVVGVSCPGVADKCQ